MLLAAGARSAPASGGDAATLVCYLHPAYDGLQPGACPTLYYRDKTRLLPEVGQHRMWVALEAGAGVRLVEVAVIPDDRESLRAPIEERFSRMLDAGLVDEVAALRARGDLSPALPSMRAVGYRQVWSYLEGDGDLDALRARGAAATRSLAKRQYTWLNRWSHVHRLAPGPAGELASRIEHLLEFS